MTTGQSSRQVPLVLPAMVRSPSSQMPLPQMPVLHSTKGCGWHVLSHWLEGMPCQTGGKESSLATAGASQASLAACCALAIAQSGHGYRHRRLCAPGHVWDGYQSDGAGSDGAALLLCRRKGSLDPGQSERHI